MTLSDQQQFDTVAKVNGQLQAEVERLREDKAELLAACKAFIVEWNSPIPMRNIVQLMKNAITKATEGE